MKSNESLTKNSMPDMPKCEICGRNLIESFIETYNGKQINTWGYDCNCIEKRNKKEEFKKQGEFLIKRIHETKENADIGKRFYNKTFSNFKKELSIKAYNECLAYVRNLEENLKQGKGLFITGNVGAGKTHLIAAMIDYIARMTKRRKKRVLIIFTTSVDMLAEIKYSFDRKIKDNETTEELMNNLENCSLLIIDDLGSEKTTDWANELFYKIIDYRYSNLKPVIITTNLTDQELKEKISERLVSRIHEMCKGIKLTGKDYRLEKLK